MLIIKMPYHIFFIFFLFISFSQYLYNTQTYPKIKKYFRPTFRNYIKKIPIYNIDSPNVLIAWFEACVSPVWKSTVGALASVSEGITNTASTRVKTASIAQLLLDCLRLGSLSQSLSSSIKGLSKSVLSWFELWLRV